VTLTDAFAGRTALKTATHKPATKNEKMEKRWFTSPSFDIAKILSIEMRCLFVKHQGNIIDEVRVSAVNCSFPR